MKRSGGGPESQVGDLSFIPKRKRFYVVHVGPSVLYRLGMISSEKF